MVLRLDKSCLCVEKNLYCWYFTHQPWSRHVFRTWGHWGLNQSVRATVQYSTIAFMACAGTRNCKTVPGNVHFQKWDQTLGRGVWACSCPENGTSLKMKDWSDSSVCAFHDKYSDYFVFVIISSKYCAVCCSCGTRIVSAGWPLQINLTVRVHLTPAATSPWQKCPVPGRNASWIRTNL